MAAGRGIDDGTMALSAARVLLPLLLLSSTTPLHAQEGVTAASPSPAPVAEEALAPSPVPLPVQEIEAPAAPAAAAVNAVRSLPPPIPSRDPQVLEYEIHRLLAVADVQADARERPEATRFDLYLRQTGLSAGRIDTLTLRLDGDAPQTIPFSAPLADAMNARADALRVLRTTLGAGPHVLRVELQLAELDKDGAPKRLAAELPFDRVPGALEQLVVLDTGTLTGPTLKFQRIAVVPGEGGSLLGFDFDRLALSSGLRYRPGDDNDPALGHARQLLRSGDSRGALVELLSIAERRRLADGSLPTFESSYWLETSRLLRSEGLLDRAQTICDELTPRRAIRRELADERLALGEARLAIGDLAGAEKQLKLAEKHLPDFRVPDWRQATGMLQLAQKRDKEARATLKVTTPDTIEAFRYMNASVEAVRATAYGRYNLAIATLRSGDAQTALSWLDLLGRAQTDDPELLSLRDKANLALGWHFLEKKQGRTAMGVLGRIRSEGLSSNRALLGMGWAQLAPSGERLPRAQLSRANTRAPDQIGDLPAPVRNSLERLRVLEPEVNGSGIGPSSFEREDPPKDRREGLQRALGIWSVLLDRDERDPAVQEARLAIAYAHDQLRDGQAARQAYGVAIDTLKRVDGAIEAESAFVSGGDLRSSLLTVADRDSLFATLDRLHLPPDSSTFALYARLDRLQQRNRLQQALIAARTRLEAPAAEGATAVDPAELITRLRSFETWLDRQRGLLADEAVATVTRRLATRRDTTREYLKTALLSAARLEDTPDLESRSTEPSCLDADCKP